MKKDKEWLKEKLLRGQIQFDDNPDVTDYEIGIASGFTVALNLVKKLDEPEVLSQEWIDENEEQEEMYWSYGVPVHKLQNLLVPKQDKPVIPQHVADWLDAHNLHGNNPLREYRDLESDFNEGWTNEKDAAVYHWVNKNPYAFIDALRYGYEVEKEKRYHVVNKENYFMLRKYDGLVDILRVSSSMSRDEYGKDTSFMLTEKEIKDYDARYWAFAEEVTE